jgi:hypothetical protein
VKIAVAQVDLDRALETSDSIGAGMYLQMVLNQSLDTGMPGSLFPKAFKI